MTEEEVILWAHLRKSALGYKFRRQSGIGKYIADFYCIEKKLVVELDGAQHLDNKTYDAVRRKFMESLGIRTVRFWNGDVRKNLSGVIMKIEEYLRKTPLVFDHLP